MVRAPVAKVYGEEGAGRDEGERHQDAKGGEA
jgi:hypothetical protein